MEHLTVTLANNFLFQGLDTSFHWYFSYSGASAQIERPFFFLSSRRFYNCFVSKAPQVTEQMSLHISPITCFLRSYDGAKNTMPTGCATPLAVCLGCRSQHCCVHASGWGWMLPATFQLSPTQLAISKEHWNCFSLWGLSISEWQSGNIRSSL